MYKLFVLLPLLFFISCTSADENSRKSSDKMSGKDSTDTGKKQEADTGLPTKEEATVILKAWFDHFKTVVGGYNYEPEKFEVLSVKGNAEKAEINFKWSGLLYPPSTPGGDHTPKKINDVVNTLLIEKKNGKWEDYEVR